VTESLNSSLHARMLAQRLRTLAWLTVPLALFAILASAALGLDGLVSNHRSLFSVAVHWAPFMVAGLALLLPLVCAPWETLTSAAGRRSTRLAAAVVGALGAGLVLGFGDAELRLSGFETCCDLAAGRPRGLYIAAWLGPLLLAQSYLIEIFAARSGHARARRAMSYGLAGLGAAAIGALVSPAGLDLAARSGLEPVELRALVPLVILLVAELGARWTAHLGPNVRKHLHERRQTNRSLGDLDPELSFSPDPAALAQGHRLNRLTHGLRTAAWVSVPLLSLVWILGDALEPDTRVGLALAAFIVIPMLVWLEQVLPALRRLAVSPPGPDTSDDDARLASELLPILHHVDHCCELLEQGHDAGFNETVMELALRVRDLDAQALDHFDRRGVEPRRLVQQLFDSEEAVGAQIAPERRRAVHHQLRKFAAQIRGQVHLDPYRAELPGAIGSGGLAWLSGGRSPLDPDLHRTRWRLGLGLGGLVVGIFLLAQLMGASQSAHPIAVCVPGLDPNCEWGFASGDAELILGTLVALAPVWLWIGARLAQWAAQLSFALALPPADELAREEINVRSLMWAAWSDPRAVGAGERWVFGLIAVAVLVGVPLFGATHLAAECDSELQVRLLVLPMVGASLLALHPLRQLHAHVVSLLVD